MYSNNSTPHKTQQYHIFMGYISRFRVNGKGMARHFFHFEVDADTQWTIRIHSLPEIITQLFRWTQRSPGI